MNTIEVDQLTKKYGSLVAVDKLSFTVGKGEIFGLLGPNGAGKSSTLAVLEGLLLADGGRVTILGHDVARQTAAVKQRIGVQFQTTSLLPDLHALEQLMVLARFYGRALTKPQAMALLEQVELQEKATTLPSQMSGGQQQRLALAMALVNEPEIIFLDEPTAGLDPQSRRRLWELVRQLQTQGRTVVLTTHYMEEAEALCHRIGIIDHGRLLALDTPGALINQLAGQASISTSAQLPLAEVAALPGVTQAWQDGALVRLQTDSTAETQYALFNLAQTHSALLQDLHISQPSLEDVFLNLTGRQIRAEG
jgi:ABC-2 type transport system ATP-binding protein